MSVYLCDEVNVCLCLFHCGVITPVVHVGEFMRKEQREAGGCLFKAKWPASGVEL